MVCSSEGENRRCSQSYTEDFRRPEGQSWPAATLRYLELTALVPRAGRQKHLTA
jgi:hypothetical protein